MRREEVGTEDKSGMRKDRGKKDEKGERIREVGKWKKRQKRRKKRDKDERRQIWVRMDG